MDEISVIELRQDSSENINNNGDWVTTLQEERILNPGDSISIRNAFIDTKSSSSGTINIEDDLTLTIQNVIYEFNWQNVSTSPNIPGVGTVNQHKKFYTNLIAKNTDIEANDDGGYYTLCDFTSAPGADFLNYTNIVFLTDNNVKRSAGVKYNFIVDYIDQTNNSVTWHSPTYKVPAEVHIKVSIPFNKIAKDKSVKIQGLDPLFKIGMNFFAFDTKALPSGGTFTPIIFTTNIVIPSGTYDPDDMARLITTKLSVNNDDKIFPRSGLATSSFLKNTDEYNGGGIDPSGTTPQGDPFVRSDGLSCFQYVNRSGRYIGTNQMALEFDSENQKFQFSAINMPIFAATTGEIVVNYQESFLNYNANDPRYFVANKHSGIAFTSLQPKEFWEDTLGFDLSLLTVDIQQTETTNVNILSGATGSLPIINYTDGVNVTGSFTGLDAIVLKKSANFYQVPFAFPIISSSSQNITIYANNSFGIQGVKSGYFLIEISDLVSSDVIGENIKSRSISGIVSRYYSADSYTSGSSDVSIPYVHRGINPITINSMGVRILNPDGSFANDIGSDNTVFLQIVRSTNSTTN